MSASWDSDRSASHRAARGSAVSSSAARMAPWLVIALAASTLLLPTDSAARRDRDSARVTQKIVVDDRGIEIVHSSDEDAEGVIERVPRRVSERVARRIKDRVKDRVEERIRHADRIRVSVDATEGEVNVDGEVDANPSDTLDFKDGGVHIGPHGITVDQNGDAGIVRMFSDAEVLSGERIEGDVVAVFGDVLVEGQVSGNVVAVFGSVRMEPGSRIDGDAVAVGGVLDQPSGAAVGGESVSLGFLPIHWGAPSLGTMFGVVFLCWLVSMFVGWILMLLFPARMIRTAITASQRTGGSLVLGLFSGPLLIIAIVLLLVTVIGVPIAFLLPIVYLMALWAGQLSLTYALGCRILRRPLNGGGMLGPLVAGSLFVAAFFGMGAIFGTGEGVVRTVALFFHLLGVLLVMGLSVIGIGAFLLSRLGSRPRDFEYSPLVPGGVVPGRPLTAPGMEPPAAPIAPPAT